MLNRNRLYLITGGTGFLGEELIARLYKSGYQRLRVVARNEGKLIALKNRYPEIEIIPGDIGESLIAAKACEGVSGVFNLAAFKHVTMAESEAFTCTRSNVVGLLNLLHHFTSKDAGDFFLHISTDKAAQMSGVYGATKYLGEKVVEEYAKTLPDRAFSVIRYGNVFRSTGSFIYKWEQAVAEGREFIITDPDATRFFFSVGEAVDLIVGAVTTGARGLVIPRIKGVAMGVVRDAFLDLHPAAACKMIGLQPGENKHETMDGVTFSNTVDQYSKDEFKERFLCPTK